MNKKLLICNMLHLNDTEYYNLSDMFAFAMYEERKNIHADNKIFLVGNDGSCLTLGLDEDTVVVNKVIKRKNENFNYTFYINMKTNEYFVEYTGEKKFDDYYLAICKAWQNNEGIKYVSPSISKRIIEVNYKDINLPKNIDKTDPGYMIPLGIMFFSSYSESDFNIIEKDHKKIVKKP